jgi:acyl carrier protein
LKRLYEIIAEVFETNIDSLDDSKGPDDIANWDSINHLRMTSELEDSFDIEFDVEEITEMQTIGAIKEILKKHGVS